ncbi:MAG: methyltransferase domain-containing protein [Candidatus Heimdallarchaeota archaeon]|nr:methyltransferase domain-containing protein [Candidatus Heimdallarchaeota archaeon]
MLKDEEDAFGQLLRDYYDGKGAFEIIERDDGFFEGSRDPRVYFSLYLDWPSLEKTALQRVYGDVLDIGCGAGRHALYLQLQGFEVVGIDVSPLAIEVCKQRGLRSAFVTSLDDLDSELGIFDTILLLGGNFGLLGNPTKAKEVLYTLSELSSPEGKIIAQSLDPYQTSEKYHLEYHQRNREQGKMPGLTRIRIRYKKYVTPWMELLLVSPDEMQELLVDTNWYVKEFLQEEQSSRYFAILMKEE